MQEIYLGWTTYYVSENHRLSTAKKRRFANNKNQLWRMAFTLDKVVPWGRSMEEYVSMFSLSSGELDSRILGCADGPASFNAEMHAQGSSVVSVQHQG